MGSHPCEGGCGATVSANKGRCLECLAKAVRFRLKLGGIEELDGEVERALSKAIGR